MMFWQSRSEPVSPASPSVEELTQATAPAIAQPQQQQVKNISPSVKNSELISKHQTKMNEKAATMAAGKISGGGGSSAGGAFTELNSSDDDDEDTDDSDENGSEGADEVNGEDETVLELGQPNNVTFVPNPSALSSGAGCGIVPAMMTENGHGTPTSTPLAFGSGIGGGGSAGGYGSATSTPTQQQQSLAMPPPHPQPQHRTNSSSSMMMTMVKGHHRTGNSNTIPNANNPSFSSTASGGQGSNSSTPRGVLQQPHHGVSSLSGGVQRQSSNSNSGASTPTAGSAAEGRIAGSRAEIRTMSSSEMMSAGSFEMTAAAAARSNTPTTAHPGSGGNLPVKSKPRYVPVDQYHSTTAVANAGGSQQQRFDPCLGANPSMMMVGPYVGSPISPSTPGQMMLLPPQRCSSSAAANSNNNFDGNNQMTTMMRCRNILVLGGPQSGKSTFINAYRLAVTHHTKWPLATVGTCGKYGTTSIDGYPNNVLRPTCMLIDTPGKTFPEADLADTESDSFTYLCQLFAGVNFGTKILGRGAVRRIDQLPPHADNKVDHVVICVSALNLVRDKGALRLWNRFEENSVSSAACVNELSELLCVCREMLGEQQAASTSSAFNNASASASPSCEITPAVVVTHMDVLVSSSQSGWLKNVKELIIHILKRCCPASNIYFLGCDSCNNNNSTARGGTGGRSGSGIEESASPSRSSSTASTAPFNLDEAYRSQMLNLHQKFTIDLGWKMKTTMR